MTKPTFDKKVKAHMAKYKRERLGVFECGVFKNRCYNHILPQNLFRLNIIETYREEFWENWKKWRNKNLHMYFHHLNSSQAMGFNLFYPLKREEKLDLISQFLVSQIRVDWKLICEAENAEFEKVIDRKEETNIDFYIEYEGGRRILIETKYTESLGAAKDNEKRNDKFDKIYEQRLKNVMKREVEKAEMLKNYQLYRYISYLSLNGEDCRKGNLFVVIVHPGMNDFFKDKHKKEIDDILSDIKDDCRSKIELVTLEDLVKYIQDNVSDPKLKCHYQLFKEKYLFYLDET